MVFFSRFVLEHTLVIAGVFRLQTFTYKSDRKHISETTSLKIKILESFLDHSCSLKVINTSSRNNFLLIYYSQEILDAGLNKASIFMDPQKRSRQKKYDH